MESIVITPKTKEEAKIITDLVRENSISSNSRIEDIVFLTMMMEADRNNKVSLEKVMEKLRP